VFSVLPAINTTFSSLLAFILIIIFIYRLFYTVCFILFIPLHGFLCNQVLLILNFNLQ
jgi:hypothetical protein